MGIRMMIVMTVMIAIIRLLNVYYPVLNFSHAFFHFIVLLNEESDLQKMNYKQNVACKWNEV